VRVLSKARPAFRALGSHKLRTTLTTLGIVIGVAAVITMVAVGAGARERVAEQIRSMGANLVLIWARPAIVGGARLGAGAQPTVTEADAWAIQREVPLVTAAAPFTSTRVGLISRNQNWSTVLQAITPEFLTVGEWDVAAGRGITQGETAAGAKVILIGATVAERLFGEADPVGQGIRVQNAPFRVVGVLDRKGQSAWGQDQDDVAMIPLYGAPEHHRAEPCHRPGGRLDLGEGDRWPDAPRRHGGDPRRAPPAPRAAARAAGRLRPPRPDRDDPGAGDLLPGAVAAAGRHRLRLAAERVRGDHEHHARVGDRAHPGDRPAHRGGRQGA
jgi:hypothetical protein